MQFAKKVNKKIKTGYLDREIVMCYIQKRTTPGGAEMTQEQLLRLQQFCKSVWNGYGEDVFQEACLIALQRYKTLDNVNQFLFKLLCKEAARKLLKPRKYEITFSQLQSFSNDFSGDFSNELDDENFENTIVDPRSDEPRSDVLLLNDFDFDDAHDDFVSFSDKKQLFQLPLPFTPFVTIQKT